MHYKLVHFIFTDIVFPNNKLRAVSTISLVAYLQEVINTLKSVVTDSTVSIF